MEGILKRKGAENAEEVFQKKLCVSNLPLKKATNQPANKEIFRS